MEQARDLIIIFFQIITTKYLKKTEYMMAHKIQTNTNKILVYPILWTFNVKTESTKYFFHLFRHNLLGFLQN